MPKLFKAVGYTTGGLFLVSLVALLWLSLPQSGWRALSVQSGSMSPAFEPGSLVLTQRVAAESLRVGDVITYKSSANTGTTITHRIIELKPNGAKPLIITKGDANAVADSPVQPSQLVGQQIASLPKLGLLIDFVRQPIGLILLAYLPIALLAIYEIKLMVERLAQLEIEKRRAAARAAAKKLYGGIRPSLASVPSSPPRKSSFKAVDAIRVVAVMSVVSMAGTPTFAALTSNTATLTGTTISTKPTTTQPPSNCTSSNNTNITVTNNNNQSATSGGASSTNNTNGGDANSGNASNSNNTTTNINVSC